MNDNETRMHSSRMRTGRSLTVCWSLLLGGGVWSGGCVWSWGVCSRGGVCSQAEGLLPGSVCSGGCLLPGGCGIPACTESEADTPPLWTESQTLVKTLPWPNFVAAGNDRVSNELDVADPERL